MLQPDLFVSEEQMEVSGQYNFLKSFWYDGGQEYLVVICNSISVKILVFWN